MKALIFLCLVVVAQSAADNNPDFQDQPSEASYKKDGRGNYAFSHHDPHLGAPSYHRESGNIQGHKFGSYGTKGLDGKVHIVDYVADHNGFQPTIRTSESMARDQRYAAGAGVRPTQLKRMPAVTYVDSSGQRYYVADQD